MTRARWSVVKRDGWPSMGSSQAMALHLREYRRKVLLEDRRLGEAHVRADRHRMAVQRRQRHLCSGAMAAT